MQSQKKGFTLIELLIVIGILAVLATITVLVLNPAQLFAQARDSQRLADLGSIKGAISLYLTTKTGPVMATAGGVCGTNYWSTFGGANEYFSGTPTESANHGRTTDGTGWVPVNLDLTTGGSPLATLPIDPANPNNATQSYTYQCNQTALTFEINANMESLRYSCGGDNDVESTDGGDSNGGVACATPATAVYEVGIDPGLNL